MLKNLSAERSKQPMLKVLLKYINVNKKSNSLEISSGTGLHASFFAGFIPNLTIQPSEFNMGMFSSIKAYIDNEKVNNVLDPIHIDISKDLLQWDAKFRDKSFSECKNFFDYIINLSMMHMSPFDCSEGLFANSSKLLKPGGLLFTYGPFAVDGVLEAESNVIFNQFLKSSDSSWGIRDILDLKNLASANFFQLLETYDLPSNNKCLVWKKAK